MNERFQSLVYGTVFAIAVGWLLFIGRDILVPVVFSVLVLYVILGLARLLARLPVVGAPDPGKAHYALSILTILVILLLTAWLVLTQLGNVVARAPDYQASLLAMIQRAAVLMGVETEPSWPSLRRDLMGQLNLQRIVGSAVTWLLSITASLVVVLLYVAFLLIEQRVFPAKLEAVSREAGGAQQLQKIIGHINDRVGTYLALKTLLSLLVGLVSYVILAVIGVEFAVFWALLIGLLNYIPYIGSWLSVIFPTLFALLQFGEIGPVLAVAAGLSVAQFFIGNFLDPYMMGNSLNLSPFAILICLTTWAALWGVAGAFLAVPITACITMVLAEFKGTRPVAILLSRNGELEDIPVALDSSG